MARKNIDFNTYVKRDLTKTTVDWGSVASKLTTDLMEVRKVREGQRAAIKKDTDETTAKLNEMEDYSNQTLQGLALGMSGDSANYLRVQNDLYKRGLLTQTEFAQNKQRILGDWQQFGNISKRWESDYVKMVQRAEDGDASSFEVWLNEQNAEFGNLNNVKGMVNPDTGALSLVRPDEYGYITNDPSRHVPMNSIQNRFNTKINNITKDGALDATLNKSVDGLGELILAQILLDEDGNETEGVLTIEGQKQALASDDVQTYLDGTVNSILSNDYKTFSVLGDLVGGYEPTLDPDVAAADPKKVLVKYSKAAGMAVPVTDAPNWAKYDEDNNLIGGQKFEAQEALKNRLISMLDNKERIKPGDAITAYEKERLALQRRAMDENTEKNNQNIDADYEMIKYGPIVKGRDKSKGQLMGGNKASTYLNKELGSDINSWSGNDSDAQVEKVFNNIIQSVMNENIFKDLESGMYEGQKPFNLSFDDEGSDRVIVEMGDKLITYPPLAENLPAISFDNLEDLNDNFKVVSSNNQEVFYTPANSQGATLPVGYYGIDTDGDGQIDTFKPGLQNYDEEGDGLNQKLYDKTVEMYDYIERNLILPVNDDLNALQKINFYGQDKNKKKKTPLSKE